MKTLGFRGEVLTDSGAFTVHPFQGPTHYFHVRNVCELETRMLVENLRKASRTVRGWAVYEMASDDDGSLVIYDAYLRPSCACPVKIGCPHSRGPLGID